MTALSWLWHIAPLVMERVVSIHPDIFQGADGVIGILLQFGARLPLGPAVLAGVPLHSGLPTLAWNLHCCRVDHRGRGCLVNE